MCQTKRCMCFLFFQPITGCPLLRRKFYPKYSRDAQKVSAVTNVRYKRVRYIEVLLWEVDHDSEGSLKNCPLLPGVRYIACPL